MNRLGPVALLLSLSLLLGAGCTEGDGSVPLTGISAFKVMRKVRSDAPSTDVASVMALIDESVVEESGQAEDVSDLLEPPVPRSRLMRKTAKAKVRVQPKAFQRPPEAFFLAAKSPEGEGKRGKDDVDLAGLQAEYLIPRVEDIPVRNQGQRGTCAAFAGIGHLEYLALQKFPALRTLDLSEQRFYYMSKPECQSSGCTTDVEGGSWYGTGFDESRAAPAPPGDNIPLEADCPYNPNPGSNELQVAQRSSCRQGAAKAGAVVTVTYPQDVVDALERYKQPVLWASPLSDNWFENRGVITAAAAGDPGASPHAGGHAYLIVGYRKLPDMPQEGGMCFIVKNSWGTGWGVNGYSCQTLEWMKRWRFRDGSTPVWLEHPVVTGLTLRDDLQGGTLPDNDDAEDDSPPDIPDDELDDDEVDGGDDVAPVPDPEPTPNVTWTAVPLYGPNDSYYKAEYGRQTGAVSVRVELKGDVPYSNALTLNFAAGSDSQLEYDGDPVGELRGDDLLLCSHLYAAICSLRLDPNDNRLYIEFPYPTSRRVKDGEVPEGDWFELLPDGLLGDYAVLMHQPDDPAWWVDNSQALVALQKPAGTTEPMRLTSNEQGRLQVMGVGVGDIAGLSLCSDDYEDSCRFLSEGARMFVLPGW